MRDRTKVGIGYAQYNTDVEGIVPLTTPVPYLPKVTVERIHPEAKLPTYASEGASGMDVYAVEDMTLAPGETALCATGLKFDIPKHPFHELGYRWELQARPRSGVSFKTALRVANAPGTVDNDFRGEVKIVLTNTAHPEYELNYEKTSVGGEYVVDSVSYEKAYQSLVNHLDGSAGCGYHEKGTILVQKGDRVAQLVFAQVIRPLEIVEGMVSEDTDRGAGGFGHTGK